MLQQAATQMYSIVMFQLDSTSLHQAYKVIKFLTGQTLTWGESGP